MAFGDLLRSGNNRTNGATVGDTTNVSITSTAAAVGDLIYAVWVETNTNGVNGVTDNLGNTYTPLSDATDSGTITGRAFYARVTNAGNLTQVSFDTTDNTNEGIAWAGLFEGPFTSSPLDRNPTNVEDITSPFSCPPTGTMAQAEELVVQWMASNDAGSSVLTDSPSTHIADLHDGGTGPNYRFTVGYRVVAATTTITPTFSENGAGNPGDSVLGVSTFMKSLSVSISPAQGNLALTKFAPSQSYGYVPSPATANLAFTTFAPNVAQYTLLPNADVDDGNWRDQTGGTSLFEAVDDLSDKSYIQSSAALVPGPTVDVCEVAFADPSGSLSQPFDVDYRYRKVGDGIVNLTVRLLEGASEIAEWEHTDIGTSFVTTTQTLSAPQFAAITDFNNLRVEFESAVISPPPARQLVLTSEPPTVTGGFTPLDFGSDLVAWYDANVGVFDASGFVAENGDNISRWEDQSGNGFHLYQDTAANQPIYRSPSPEMNNKKAVDYVLYEDFINTRLNAVVIGGTVLSIFAVVYFRSLLDQVINDNRVAGYVAAGQTQDYLTAGGGLLYRHLLDYTGGNPQVFGGYRNSAANVLSHQNIALDSNDGPNKAYRVGGIWDSVNFTSYLDNVAGTPEASSGTFASTGTIGVGCVPFFANETHAGLIAEVIFVKRALSSAERLALHQYFTGKWGF